MEINKSIAIAGNSDKPFTVKRLGYGTIRLTGNKIYGEPNDKPEALNILKQALEPGVQFLDTTDYYGDDVTNRLIAEALFPYPDDLVNSMDITQIRHYFIGHLGENKKALEISLTKENMDYLDEAAPVISVSLLYN